MSRKNQISNLKNQKHRAKVTTDISYSYPSLRRQREGGGILLKGEVVYNDRKNIRAGVSYDVLKFRYGSNT